jgi:hypothetical protein
MRYKRTRCMLCARGLGMEAMGLQVSLMCSVRCVAARVSRHEARGTRVVMFFFLRGGAFHVALRDMGDLKSPGCVLLPAGTCCCRRVDAAPCERRHIYSFSGMWGVLTACARPLIGFAFPWFRWGEGTRGSRPLGRGMLSK